MKYLLIHLKDEKDPADTTQDIYKRVIQGLQFFNCGLTINADYNEYFGIDFQSQREAQAFIYYYDESKYYPEKAVKKLYNKLKRMNLL